MDELPRSRRPKREGSQRRRAPCRVPGQAFGSPVWLSPSGRSFWGHKLLRALYGNDKNLSSWSLTAVCLRVKVGLIWRSEQLDYSFAVYDVSCHQYLGQEGSEKDGHRLPYLDEIMAPMKLPVWNPVPGMPSRPKEQANIPQSSP